MSSYFGSPSAFQAQQAPESNEGVSPYSKLPTANDVGAVALLEDYTIGSRFHGQLVSDSARSRRSNASVFDISDELDEVQQTGESDAWHQLSAGEAAKSNPQQFMNALHSWVADTQADVLDTAGFQLDDLREHGMHAGAVNISKEVSERGTTTLLWNQYMAGLRPDANESPDQQKQDANFTDNLSQALGLDEDKLRNHDPHEQARLEHALIDQTKESFNGSTSLKEAQQHFSKSVQDLESRNVSVVIAAGNGGHTEADLKAGGDGTVPDNIPKGEFYNNLLAAPGTVVVGATQDDDGQPKLAEYNSPGPYNMLADGDAPISKYNPGGREHGTSEAAPRVAVELGALHKQFPNESNQQVLQRLQGSAKESIQGVPVLPPPEPLRLGLSDPAPTASSAPKWGFFGSNQ